MLSTRPWTVRLFAPLSWCGLYAESICVQPLCGHGSSRLLGGRPASGLLGQMETPVTLLRRHCSVPTQLRQSPCPILIVGWGWVLTMISRWVSLTVSEHLLLVGHSCLLFGEMSVQILCFFSFFFSSFKFFLFLFFFFCCGLFSSLP